jgi:hypothetical protein
VEKIQCVCYPSQKKRIMQGSYILMMQIIKVHCNIYYVFEQLSVSLSTTTYVLDMFPFVHYYFTICHCNILFLLLVAVSTELISHLMLCAISHISLALIPMMLLSQNETQTGELLSNSFSLALTLRTLRL